MTSNSGAALVKKGHPIRGILWGIMFGLGLAGVLVVTEVISLDLTQIIIVLLLGLAVGVLWSLFGPAKAPKGLPPAAASGFKAEEPSAASAGEEEAVDMLEGGAAEANEQLDALDAGEGDGEASDDDGQGWRSND